MGKRPPVIKLKPRTREARLDDQISKITAAVKKIQKQQQEKSIHERFEACYKDISDRIYNGEDMLDTTFHKMRNKDLRALRQNILKTTEVEARHMLLLKEVFRDIYEKAEEAEAEAKEMRKGLRTLFDYVLEKSKHDYIQPNGTMSWTALHTRMGAVIDETAEPENEPGVENITRVLGRLPMISDHSSC
jgi:hypothetical protein